MWKKSILIVFMISVDIFPQHYASRIFGGVTLPIGAEIGFVGETHLPKIEILKLFSRGSIIWVPFLRYKESTIPILIGGLQPGLRLKFTDDVISISGGLSVNPILPIPYDRIVLGFGTFFGLGFQVKNVEIGLYGTTLFNNERYISKLGLYSLTISKAFPILNYNRHK